MGTYDGWRVDGGPTLYGPNKTAVTADVLEAGLIFAAVILGISLLVVLPGIRGRERLFSAIRVVLAVFILACILLVNFGQEWEVASVETITQYRAGLREEIKADISVKIGLRSVNITLKGKPEEHIFEGGQVNETINYNERFHWDNLGFTQGRIGFGPFASTINQEFRAAQFKGLPYPILWIAEYFTIDGEGIRWGRHYRQAGYYTHIVVWTAFPMWVLTLVLFHMVLRYGGYFMVMTGGCLLLSNIIYASIRNPFDLVIPFEDGKLEFSWGWCFWLCMFNGLICVVLGAAVIIMDLFWHEALATFFGVDVAQEFEEYDADENLQVTTGAGVENGNTSNTGEYEDTLPKRTQFRRRTTKNVTHRVLRTRKSKPRPAPRENRETLDVDPLYENASDVAPSSSGRVTFSKGADNSAYEDDQNTYEAVDADVHLELPRKTDRRDSLV